MVEADFQSRFTRCFFTPVANHVTMCKAVNPRHNIIAETAIVSMIQVFYTGIYHAQTASCI